MHTFFEDLSSLDRFTHELDSHVDTEECHHCRRHGQLVSRGFVYKKQHCGDPLPIGKRIFCSNRCGRSGCGRQYHGGIQMAPLDRFNLDRARLVFLTDGWASNSRWDAKALMEYVGWKDIQSAMRYIDTPNPFSQRSIEQGLTSKTYS